MFTNTLDAQVCIAKFAVAMQGSCFTVVTQGDVLGTAWRIHPGGYKIKVRTVINHSKSFNVSSTLVFLNYIVFVEYENSTKIIFINKFLTSLKKIFSKR